MRVVSVPAVGTRPAEAFVHGQMQRCDLKVYPPSPQGEAIRQARIAVYMTLREAAELLGISPAELSAIEIGRVRIVDEGDYAEALAKLLP